MKKINLAVTFAVLALSAVPLMAQQVSSGISVHLLTTPASINQEQIRQAAQQAVQNGVQNFRLGMQNRNIIDAINEDINSTAKYQKLLRDFNNFLELMEDNSLVNQKEEIVGHTIFIRIDDLAKSILDLPQHAQPYYIDLITKSKYNFKYNEEVVTLENLFNLATSLKSIYLRGNTAIEQILAKQENNNNTKTWQDSYSKEVLQDFEQNANSNKF